MSHHPLSSSSSSSRQPTKTTTPPKKKAKTTATSLKVQGVGRSRRGACDSCRSRKIKCLRVEIEGIVTNSEACIPCRGIQAECTYKYVPKRPGPQSSKQSTQKQVPEQIPKRQISASKDEISTQANLIKAEGEKPDSFYLGRGSIASASSYASTSSASLEDALNIPLPYGTDGYFKSALDSVQPDYSFELSRPFPQRSEAGPYHFNSQIASLDDIAPRQQFLDVISLYYQHLYPLCPVVHQPTFSQELLNRKDDSDIDFLIFVLSLTCFTLVQLPQSLISSTLICYQELQKTCHDTSRRLQRRTYETPKLIHLATLYLDHIYLSDTGLNNAANVVLGEAIRLGHFIGIYNERPQYSAARAPRSPLCTSNIDIELRRRIFFLLYGSDRMIALLQNQPITLRDEDICGIKLPLAIDDDMITVTDIYVQPPQRGPSVLCGFEVNSRLFLLLSALLDSHRRDQRRQPANLVEVNDRLTFISGILHQIKGVLGSMPTALQTSTGRMDASESVFSSMRVDILMTETTILFSIADYTDFLYRLKEQYRGGIQAQEQDYIYIDNDWESVARDMVNTLHTTPFDCIAVNGQSMIAKLLYLTSTLLNRSSAGSSGFQYMCHFLDILTRLTSSRSKE